VLSGFGQSNGDGLFSTFHLSSGATAFQLTTLKLVHRSLNVFLRFFAVLASHDFLFLSLGVTFECFAPRIQVPLSMGAPKKLPIEL
jgi:hypothetical protein